MRSPDTIEVHAPADGALLGTVDADSPDAVAQVAERIRANQAIWADGGFRTRAKWLLSWRDWMFDHQARLTDLLQDESGKVRAEADFEIPTTAAAINYYAKYGKRFIAEERPRATFALMKTKRS